MEQNQYPFPQQNWQTQPGPVNPNMMPPMQQNMPPYGMPGMPVQPGPAQQGKAPKGKKNTQKSAKKGGKKKWITLGIFTLIGLVLGGLLFAVADKYFKQMTVINLPGQALVINEPEPEDENEDTDGMIEAPVVEAPAADLAGMTSGQGEKWNGNTRITCLAMGLDYRDWMENDGAPRSDSMMLLTYDPASGLAGMLSIPRDTWVAIPGFDYGRINTAYSLGEAYQIPGVDGKPGGGPGLAMRTVELFLGVDIQYYAVIDFNGFIHFIDTIDKLAINVRDEITVGEEEGVPIHLWAGVQDLDGKTALAYARYRYTEGGDFERAQRQQDVLYALYKQMRWQLPELLTTKSDQLFKCIQEAIKSNIPMDDLLKLAWTLVDIHSSQIKRGVISPPNQVLFDKAEDGQQILVPIPDRIRETRDMIFKNNSSGARITEEYTKTDRLRDEGARVTLMNGSTVAGLVEKTAAYLQENGINVVSQGMGSGGYYNTMVIKNGKPYAAQYLATLMNIPTEAIVLDYDPNAGTDLIVTITDAWANSNPMP